MPRKKLSLAEKTTILERQDMKCIKCGRTITVHAKRLRDWFKELGHYPDKSVPSQAKFHHLRRVADGGSDSLTNYAATCGRCHTVFHGKFT